MKLRPAFIITTLGLLLSAANALASPPQERQYRATGRQSGSRSHHRSPDGDIFFEPKAMEIKAGETVRFVLLNEGALLHEFNLGKAASHAAHQKEMAAMFQNGTLSPTAAHDMSKWTTPWAA